MKLFVFTICIISAINCIAQKEHGPTPVEATETNPFGGGKSKALLYFNCVNTDGKIRKPLIVFEGYDPGYYTKPKEKEGRTGIGDFLKEITNEVQAPDATAIQLLLQGNEFANPPVTQEYDIIYVNWKNGTDYLENNEKVAKAVINHVNYLKTQSGSTEPNVIIGRSMGALIARMALKHMELERVANPGNPNYPLHQTRLFISNDGGMQGSNIPEGYQYMLNHFRDLYIQSGPLAMFIEGSTNVTNFSPEYLFSKHCLPDLRRGTVR